MLSFTHIPVAARAAHRVINVIVFIFHLSFFLCYPYLSFYLFTFTHRVLVLSCFPTRVVILTYYSLCSEDGAKVRIIYNLII